MIAFIDIKPSDEYDIWVPANPYSLYRRFTSKEDPYFDIAGTRWLGVVLFLFTLLFLADAVIVFMSGINTPYGIITGSKAFKVKLGKKMGSQNYIKLFSPIYVGFKIARFKDSLQYFLSFNAIIYITAALMLTLIITACHYGARMIVQYEEQSWDDNFCAFPNKDSTKTFKEIATDYKLTGLKRLDQYGKETGMTICQTEVEMVTDPICRNYLPMLKVVADCKDKKTAACENLVNLKRNIAITQYTESMCNQSHGQLMASPGDDPYHSVYERYLRVLYELFTIASAEGSDVTAYYVTDMGRYWSMVIVILSGILLRGLADAYLLTIYSEEYSPTIHTYNRLVRIETYLKSVGTSVHASRAVKNFLDACYSTFNQITVTSEAYILHMLPVRLRRFAKERDTFMNLNVIFKNPKFIVYLTEYSREFFFPPGLCSIYEGDLHTELMIVVRGTCFEVGRRLTFNWLLFNLVDILKIPVDNYP